MTACVQRQTDNGDYSVRNVMGIVKAAPELAQRVVKMRYAAKMILEKFAGKAIHPVAGVPGLPRP